MPLGLLAGLGATAFSSGAKGLFSGLSRRDRNTRLSNRDDRRKRRQERRAARRKEREATVGLPASQEKAEEAKQVDTKAKGEGFDMEKLTAWLKENWYIPAAIGGLLLLMFLLKKKNKVRNRRRTYKARTARRSYKRYSRTSPAVARAKKRRYAPGRKKTKAEIRAERLRNLAKARRVKKAKRR